MTIEEIFGKIASHMVEGLMLHEQMCNYYEFLSLDGYKCCHKYHYLCETLSHREIQSFYMNKYNKLIPESPVDSSSAIPASWYKYTRQEVDIQTKRAVIKSGLEKWLKWEKDTSELYSNLCAELEALHEYASADKVRELINNADDEIRHAEKKHLILGSVDYNMIYIMQEQWHLKEKYIKKMKKLL